MDYSLYDNDGDGYVDYLFLVHVGSGQEYSKDPNDIWSQVVELSGANVVETNDFVPGSDTEKIKINTFIVVPEY